MDKEGRLEAHRRYNLAYYYRNKEKILAQRRECGKEFRAKYKEKLQIDKTTYRLTHPQNVKKWRDTYLKTHKEDIRWHKLTCDMRINGKRIYGITKRAYLGYCELCGGQAKKFDYHHWDDSDIKTKKIKGIWVCWWCHWLCELVDKNKLQLVQRYLKLKRTINKQHKAQVELKPEQN